MSEVCDRCIESEELLRAIRRQLNQWAYESGHRGRSTHQVEPQQVLAAKIQQFLDRR